MIAAQDRSFRLRVCGFGGGLGVHVNSVFEEKLRLMTVTKVLMEVVARFVSSEVWQSMKSSSSTSSTSSKVVSMSHHLPSGVLERVTSHGDLGRDVDALSILMS